MLVFFCRLLLTFFQIWLSYAPIADYTADYYNTNTDSVNYLSLVYMIASAAFGAVSAFILDYMGLRAGVSKIFYGLKIWHVKEYPT